MPVDLSQLLVVGISSRALFDLAESNKIFEQQGLDAYCRHQQEHEDDTLQPGTGFPLVKALLRLNTLVPEKRKVEVVVMSRNGCETSMRLWNSIKTHGLDITRAALTSGAALAPYLHAYKVHLFLSLYEDDVQAAVDAGIAAALLYDAPQNQSEPLEQIRIAFDGDAVIFSDESEQIYQEQGLEAFIQHERENARQPLPEGPFARLLKTLAFMQKELNVESPPIRTALVTARNSPAHERVIRTLQAWEVRIDEAFFLGGMTKNEVLAAFRPHMFFDDQHVHCELAARVVPTGRVPYKRQNKGNKSDNNNKRNR